MDIAVNLVESYLRLTGYLTLSEFEVQARNDDGTYRTVTDVDVVGLRFPGDVMVADAHGDCECNLMLTTDEVLQLDEDLIDVIIGEVKQGDAVFNPGLKSHAALHSVLRRIEWLFPGGIDGVLAEIQEEGVSMTEGVNGTRVRVRLVAFGQAPHSDLHTINLTHIIRTMTAFMSHYDDVLRPARFSEPAPALLRLLTKVGFVVEKRPGRKEKG